MGRFTEHRREKIDVTVERWRDQCLLADNSLLFGDDEVWSLANLEELHRRFVEEEIEGDQSFRQKLEQQLAGAPRGVVRLAAEVFLVYSLFVVGAINPQGKRDIIRWILAQGQESPDEPDEELDAWKALDEGIGNPGGGYNFRRPTEMRFLIEAVRALKQEPLEKRAEVLGDPWKLQEFLDSQEQSGAQFRHIWLHLMYPEEFERIASSRHKHWIIDVFGGVLDEGERSDNIDRELFAIRRKLQEILPDDSPLKTDEGFDFYKPPLIGAWFSGDPADHQALEFKGQLVFYGPPGTSKSYDAEQLGRGLIRSRALRRWGAPQFFAEHEAVEAAVESNLHYLQLHPAYSYEEFIGGLTLTEGGGTAYLPGYLPRLVDEMKEAREADPDRALPHVLILDEMNRADLSRVLGEAFSLLERDKRDQERELTAIDPSTEETPTLEIPSDLYFIGTMNLIDQSVEQVDFALRRRFLWRELGFERDRLLEVLEWRWERTEKRVPWDRVAGDMERLADAAQRLNDRIAELPLLGPEYAIGHTYFFDVIDLVQNHITSGRQQVFLWNRAQTEVKPALQDLWDLALYPLLEQYLAGTEADQRQRTLDEDLYKDFTTKP